MAAVAYYILECAIIAKEGRDSLLAQAVGRDWKAKLSLVLYFVAIPLAFVSPWIAGGLYVFGALLWLIPDPRIEHKLEKREEIKQERKSSFERKEQRCTDEST
jgi:hypothetical protein